MKQPKPLFKIGQVVRVDTEWYRTYYKAQEYQRITRRFAWPECKAHPFGYRLANGDSANEMYLHALSEKEVG